MRKILGVIAGYVVWTVIWLGGGVGLAQVWPDLDGTQPIEATVVLVSMLGLSVVCSLLAGLVTRRLAQTSGPVLVMAVLLLATGAAVQASAWELMPVWYHIAFLALLVPVSVGGSWLGAPREAR